MPPTYTPLRYPGGKAKLGPYLAEVLKANKLDGCTYAEPFAGGAGAGLFLLFRGYAKELLINDSDRGVASFWRALLAHPSDFARGIETVPLTIDEWDRQRDIYLNGRMGFDHGFAFFYLNRTNRSGIMNGGVIGGRRQLGQWGIDARFNREELAERVRAIGRMATRIQVTRRDAAEFLSELKSRQGQTFVYLDPPYFHKGQQLYQNWYQETDHREIATALRGYPHPWLVTYDDCPEIRGLYRARRVYESELSYSAREVRRGEELVIFGPYVREPDLHAGATSRWRGFSIGDRIAS